MNFTFSDPQVAFVLKLAHNILLNIHENSSFIVSNWLMNFSVNRNINVK